MTNQRMQSWGPGSGPVDEQEVNLFDYVRVIWRRRWMILVLSVVVTMLTGSVVFMSPRRYEANVTIVPPLEILQKEVGVGGLGAMGKSMLRDIIDSGSIAEMYVEILNSREVADSIIDKFRLMEVYKDIKYRTQATKLLKRNTRIEMTKEGAVKIAVTDLDPNRAAAMAEAYVERLDQQNKRLSAGQATSKRLFLENRLKEVEGKLSRIETIPAREAQVQEMLYELLIRELELAKIEEARSMPTIQVLDKAEVPELPVARGTIKKSMAAGIAALIVGIFVAFNLEYFEEAKQAGLARQFERATRRRKAAGNGKIHTPSGDGQKQHGPVEGAGVGTS
ncbi:MAG: hypothetical protein JW955_02705 [Sedimentisphaerales bacterium]|nr:hypothetical protein [Sedimentisphaerales bacterium]